MESCSTFTAQIYCGLQESYDGPTHSLEEAIQIVQLYVNSVGLGVTVTPTEFVYTNGREPGVIVGLINYPRYPSEPNKIKYHATQLATQLLFNFKQERCSIVFSDDTIMLERK